MTPKTVAIIPARLGSTRFPGKPLATILGITMLEHIYRRARMNRRFVDVCIATCDQAIADAARGFGCASIMTSPAHERGTERVAEAAERVDADVVVNLQGDEPLIAPEIFDDLLAPFDGGTAVECTNLMAPLATDAEQDNRNNVKVVVDRQGCALYFSREAIPTRHMGRRMKAFRQIGIYAFRRDVLLDFLRLPPSELEATESCDMLRLVDHGHRIQMIRCDVPLQSVDTPEDLRVAENMMRSDPLTARYLVTR